MKCKELDDINTCCQHMFSMTTRIARQDPDPAGSVIYWPSGSVILYLRTRIRENYLRIRTLVSTD
jgi:hypothetical protein